MSRERERERVATRRDQTRDIRRYTCTGMDCAEASDVALSVLRLRQASAYHGRREERPDQIQGRMRNDPTRPEERVKERPIIAALNWIVMRASHLIVILVPDCIYWIVLRQE
jgi:hypothetical protein